MKQELTKIERLNWAAEALASERRISWRESLAVICAPLFVIWDPRFQKHDWEFIVVGIAALVTLMCWFHHRYAFLALSLVELAVGVMFLYLFQPIRHSHFSLEIEQLVAPVAFFQGFRHVGMSLRYAAVQNEDWVNERAQVRQWLDILRGKQRADKVIEIPGIRFGWDLWWANVTYRFLNTGECWAMVAFKKGEEDKLPIDYQIYERSAITMEVGPGGKSTAHVNGKVIPFEKGTWRDYLG